MRRVLVIGGGAIGDLILTLPAIAALRLAFPNAHIDVMGDPKRVCLGAPSRRRRAVGNVPAVQP